ncbi:MAG: barstar family protein [Pirellulaceae bacterium]
MSTEPPGFHFVDAMPSCPSPEIVEVAIPAEIRRRRELLARFAEGLRFPDYFGWNWDALEECLGDLSWLADAEQIVVRHADVPFAERSRHRRTYLQILATWTAGRHAASGIARRVVLFPSAYKAPVLACLTQDEWPTT